jgi:ferredoxin--NADP+ reductase
VTRWYNGHPEAPDLRAAVEKARSLVIIGQGNVALDVARVFAKTAGERAMTDFPRAVEEALDAASLTDIHVVGRRGPGETHFSPEMLAELERLSRAVLLVRAEEVAGLASEEANPTRFRAWSANTPQEGKLSLRFHFGVSPLSLVGEGAVSGVVLRAADGSTKEIAAELVVRCIGFEAQSLGELSPEGGHFRHEEGRIREGLYVAGWAGRGSSGTIATNRAEAHQVAARILSEVSEKAERRDLGALLLERGVRVAPLSAWARIQAAEVAGARPERVREKLTSWEALLAAGFAGPV